MAVGAADARVSRSAPWPASGPVDVLVPGLDAGAWLTGHAASRPRPGGPGRRPARRRGGRRREPVLAAAQPAAADAVAAALAGRPAILRHHDLPWQRERFAGRPPAARRSGLAARDDQRAIPARAGRPRASPATVVRNAFDTRPPAGDRAATRRSLGIEDGRRLVLQPTRAIPRKDVPPGWPWPRPSDADYWLLGPGRGAVPRRAGPGPGRQPGSRSAAGRSPRWTARRRRARLRGLRRRRVPLDAGRGSATRRSRRPSSAARWRSGPIRSAAELRALGFRWFDTGRPRAAGPAGSTTRTPALLDHNLSVVRRHLDLAGLPGRLADSDPAPVGTSRWPVDRPDVPPVG